jgi:hypothetical protein
MGAVVEDEKHKYVQVTKEELPGYAAKGVQIVATPGRAKPGFPFAQHYPVRTKLYFNEIERQIKIETGEPTIRWWIVEKK